ITISGGMTGRMAAKGRPVQGLASTRTGFLGNVSISGAIAASGALVSAGMIGDQAGGTGLTIGSVQGIIAAKGSINLVKGKKSGAAFFGANLTGANAAAIDAIFTHMAFDSVPGSLDLKGLGFILADLNALAVSNGVLTDPGL